MKFQTIYFVIISVLVFPSISPVVKANEVDDPDANNTDFVPAFQPIIGILSQPVKGTNTSEIQTSYVNFIETGGGRVAPIPLDISDEKLFYIAKNINGVLFPGGGTALEKNSRYYSIHEFFLDYSIQQSEMGNHFPVWGTCLGFQGIAQYAAQNYTLIPESRFHNFNILLPLEWNPDYDLLKSSHMLNLCKSTILRSDTGTAPTTNFPYISETPPIETKSVNKGNNKHSEFKKLLKRDLSEASTHFELYHPWDQLMCSHRLFKATQWLPLAAYNHRNGVTLQDWNSNPKLGEMFEPLAYSVTDDGVKFVTVMEAKDYPIYAVQFHPEKNLFAFSPSINAPHGFFSSEMTQYFANFLVSEARKNNQRFPDPLTEFNNLIFKYQVTNTLMSDKIYDFLPMYLFPMDPSMLYVTVSKNETNTEFPVSGNADLEAEIYDQISDMAAYEESNYNTENNPNTLFAQDTDQTNEIETNFVEQMFQDLEVNASSQNTLMDAMNAIEVKSN